MKNSQINKLRQRRNLALKKYKAFNIEPFPDSDMGENIPCILCQDFLYHCNDMTYKDKARIIALHVAFKGDYSLI